VFQSDGVTYQLPMEGSSLQQASAFMKAVTPTGLKWSSGTHAIEVRNGKVTLDGKPHGSVRKGDTVWLTSDGKLIINGNRRQPTGP